MEFAGEVVAVGRQVTLFAPGDRVMAVVGGGAQATLAFVDETHALARARRTALGRGRRLPEVFTTAYDALFRQAALQMASASWCRAPPGASARPACSWRSRPAPSSRRPCANPDGATRWQQLGADVVLAPATRPPRAL